MGGGCVPSHGREIFQFWGSESCNLVHSLVRFLAFFFMKLARTVLCSAFRNVYGRDFILKK